MKTPETLASSPLTHREHAAHHADGNAALLSERVQSLRLPQHVVHGSRGASWFPWLLCLILAGAVGFLGYAVLSDPGQPASKSQSSTAANESTKDDAADVSAAGGAAVAPSEALTVGNVALDAKGYVIPVKQVLVSPKVSGMIVKSAIREGRFVRQGEELARLEDIDYQADVHRAKATLDSAQQRLKELRNYRPEEISQAKAELAEAQAQLVQLESSWKRGTQLLKTSAMAVSDFEEAESKYRAMQRKVDRLTLAVKLMEDGPRLEKRLAAEADVRQAEADLRKAEWRLENTVIRAPISGTILKKNAEEGNIVNPIAMNGSFSLCDLADLSDLEVEVAIMENDISHVFKGQKCRIRPNSYPNRTYEGEVSRLMPIADRAKGAVWVRVKVHVPPAEEEGTYLKPEMGALVAFLSKNAPAATASKSAITP
jgi:HlyD family secretion protein